MRKVATPARVERGDPVDASQTVYFEPGGLGALGGAAETGVDPAAWVAGDAPRIWIPPTILSTVSVADPAEPVKNSTPMQRSVSMTIMCSPRRRMASRSALPRSLRSTGGSEPR